jgi:hypothetical protein
VWVWVLAYIIGLSWVWVIPTLLNGYKWVIGFRRKRKNKRYDKRELKEYKNKKKKK